MFGKRQNFHFKLNTNRNYCWWYIHKNTQKSLHNFIIQISFYLYFNHLETLLPKHTTEGPVARNLSFVQTWSLP